MVSLRHDSSWQCSLCDRINYDQQLQWLQSREFVTESLSLGNILRWRFTCSGARRGHTTASKGSKRSRVGTLRSHGNFMEFGAETDSTNLNEAEQVCEFTIVHTNIAKTLPTSQLHSPGAEASWPCASRAPAVPATVPATRPVARPWSPGPSLDATHLPAMWVCLKIG